MNGEEIFAFIMMFGCCFGCGAMIFGIGLWAERSKKPFGFWTFKEVKAEAISDVPAYNRENGKLWKLYSIPFFLAALCGIFGMWHPWLNILAVSMIILVCTLGTVWLIWYYKHILRKYSL